MIRFLVDAQLPPGLARKLVERGYAAEHVNAVGLGVARDQEIWAYARNTEATLITKDEDFVLLARSDPAGPAVVWIRLGNIANESLWRAFDPLLVDIIKALELGERLVEVD